MAIALGPYEMRVQVAFDAGPFNASPTWTEVTDDVMASEGVSFSRGARSVGGKPGPGLLDLRMRNWAEDDRTNLVKYPSAESGTTGWSGTDSPGMTFASSSSQSYSGTKSYECTSSASGVMDRYGLHTEGSAATPGATYTGSVYVRAASTSANAYATLLFWNSGGGFISASDGAVSADSSTAWSRRTVTATAPAGTAFVTLGVIWTVAAAGEVHYFDAAMIEEGSTVGAYFDGATSGYEWTGTPHASTSRTAAIRRAGRWTPGVTTGPWHPLKLKRRIRLQARYNGGSWVGLWGGHITDYVPKFIGAAQAVCDLSASDLLTALSLLKAFPSAVLAEQLYDSPVLCYPLDDSEGSITAGDRTVSNRPSLTVEQIGSGGAVDFGSGSVGPEGATCAAFTPVDGSNYAYLAATLPAIPCSGLTVVAVYNPSVLVNREIVTVADTATPSAATDGSIYASLGLDISGRPVAITDQNRALSYGINDTTAATVGEWAHAALRLTSSGDLDLFVDGVLVASVSGAPVPAVLRGIRVAQGPRTFGPWDGQIANVAVYDTALSDARIAEHYLAMTGWAGELTGSRFQRLARLAGLPSGLISTGSSAGGSTMGVQPVGGKTLTSALGEVAVTEQGAVDVDRDGLLRFAGRDLRRGAPSVVTLDARSDILGDFDGLPFNDEGLLNDVTVSRVNGATQRAVNQASSDEYGPITDSIEVWLNDDAEALRLAEWLANKDAQPQLRAPVLKISMAALAARSPGKVDAVMALERGQRITVDHLPEGLPATSLDLFVEGISDEWGKNDWVRTITTSSLWRNGAVWILGDPFYGVLGSTTILGY